MTKRSLVLFSALLILTLGSIGCTSEESNAATITTTQEAPPLPADVTAVAEATEAANTTIVTTTATATSSALEATGEFVSSVRSELSPKMPGRVARMHVDEGARVRRGQPVLELESDYVRLNLRAAEAETARSRSAMDEAGRDLARKKELAAKNSIPKSTFERSQATFEQASAAHASATAQAALLRQHLADSTLRSPVDGIVAEKRTDVGARLGDNGVAFVVVQISPLKLRFQVPERYLGKLKVGDAVTARVDPYPGETFTGRIRTIGGVIDPKTRTMFAEAEFANRDGRLKPGLFARVEARLN